MLVLIVLGFAMIFDVVRLSSITREGHIIYGVVFVLGGFLLGLGPQKK